MSIQIDKPLPPFIAETSMSDLELNTYNLQRPNYTINMFCFHDHKASELPSQSFELTVCGFYSILSFSLRLLVMLETVFIEHIFVFVGESILCKGASSV